MPLFWVIPLALYLLSFRPHVQPPRRRALNIPPSSILHRIGAPFMALLALLPQPFSIAIMPVHLAVFFAATMMLNGRLVAAEASLRRNPRYFTCGCRLGGVLGGAFNTFLQRRCCLTRLRNIR